jgi:hypothetical protein
MTQNKHIVRVLYRMLHFENIFLKQNCVNENVNLNIRLVYFETLVPKLSSFETFVPKARRDFEMKLRDLSHPVGTWPQCDHCFGPDAAMRHHKSRACMKPDEYSTPCKPSKINPNKCDWLIHHESIMKCPHCNRWLSKTFTAYFGLCERCNMQVTCDSVTAENREYRKSIGEW